MKHLTPERRFVATPHVKMRITEQGRNNRWVARQLGLSDSHFSRILTGERWISEHHARIVSSLLGVEFGVLWKVSEGTITVSIGTSSEIAGERVPA